MSSRKLASSGSILAAILVLSASYASAIPMGPIPFPNGGNVAAIPMGPIPFPNGGNVAAIPMGPIPFPNGGNVA